MVIYAVKLKRSASSDSLRPVYSAHFEREMVIYAVKLRRGTRSDKSYDLSYVSDEILSLICHGQVLRQNCLRHLRHFKYLSQARPTIFCTDVNPLGVSRVSNQLLLRLSNRTLWRSFCLFDPSKKELDGGKTSD